MPPEATSLDEVIDVPNLLLSGPSVDASVDSACKHLLDANDDSAVLVVSFMLPPGEWIDQWTDRVGDFPEDLVIVATSDTFNQPGSENLPDDVTVEYLSSPGDLTGIGMAISKYLERWHDDGREITICFDSLTTLLQYAEARSVYRFLHLITTRLSGVDARAHFHFDPATQDDQTVSTIASAFPAIARLNDDSWEIKSR